MAIKKILLVDDSPAQLEELKDAVKGYGAKVLAVNNGEDAIDKAINEKPDIILMDIIMDGMDGYNACREIVNNQLTKDIPIVFVSTKNQRADKMWAERLGARALISKPYTKDEIVSEVNKYA
jgi:twitching motility two-component system response regulator PilH